MIYIGTNEWMPDDCASQQATKQCRYEMSGLKSGKAANAAKRAKNAGSGEFSICGCAD